MTIDELHFVVEALGDAVVAGEAPHGDDLVGPSGESLAELHELDQTGLAQLMYGAEEARDQDLALPAVRCFFRSR